MVRRRAITAFEELQRQGQFGIECLQLTMVLVAEEARRFPTLWPNGRWQPVDIEDLAADFLADRLESVTVMLLAQAGDDASLGKLLRRSVRNWLIDRARRTDLGALRRTLEAVLASDEKFEKVARGDVGAGRWRLADTGVPPWAGDPELLVDVARSIRSVRIPRWNSVDRRAPVADRASLTAVAHAVLRAAGGSLEVAQLAHIFVRRFPVVLDRAAEVFELNADVAIALTPTPEAVVIAAEDELDAAADATAVVGMLSPVERSIVSCMDDVQAVRTLLGCGRSTAYHHMARLREKLVQLVGDHDGGRAIAREVIRLCGSTDT